MANRRASAGEPARVCFVCMGNICRSPMAEAVMRDLIRQAGLSASIEVDSAGTSNQHVGDAPDVRALDVLRTRGVSVTHRGRQFTRSFFDSHDLLLVMDVENRTQVLRLAPNGDEAAKIRLLRSFDAEADADGATEIADPYYGGPDDFARVFDEILASCRGLLAYIQKEYLDQHE